MRISDLQVKKIINTITGKNLGSIIDAEISMDGKIESFIVEQNKNFLSLNREGDKKVFWENIIKIGEDVILVKID